MRLEGRSLESSPLDTSHPEEAPCERMDQRRASVDVAHMMRRASEMQRSKRSH